MDCYFIIIKVINEGVNRGIYIMNLFSIVIPLYNKEKHIARAIESVLNQTIQDFEIIVINDGSTDLSADIVKSYTDERID